MSCDPDCEAGSVHCWNIHRPRHKRDWHDGTECDRTFWHVQHGTKDLLPLEGEGVSGQPLSLPYKGNFRTEEEWQEEHKRIHPGAGCHCFGEQ